MSTILKILSVLFFVITCSCENSWEVSPASRFPLIAKDTTKKLEKENNLLVFVGERIKVYFDKKISTEMDGAFRAKYKVLQWVYGTYERDTIEFIAFDHYGTPRFSKFRHVLLYVVRLEDGSYHVKYQYNDVYRTRDEKWAGPYSVNDYLDELNAGTTVKPIKIAFRNEVSYPIREDDEDNGISYPEPYYEISDKRAIAVYGNYIEDLFKLKKDGALTEWGLFGDTLWQPKPVKQEVIPESCLTICPLASLCLY